MSYNGMVTGVSYYTIFWEYKCINAVPVLCRKGGLNKIITIINIRQFWLNGTDFLFFVKITILKL